MKKILIIHTGGTIGSESTKIQRSINENSVKEAKRILFTCFKNSGSKYAEYADLFEDAEFPETQTTLSESMHPQKLSEIINHLKQFDFNDYAGIIVLHGTDTLAFTAALFSYIYSYLTVPMILVSGNRPPDDNNSNANINFKTAVELIWEGIAPNVYAVYRNSDKTIRLFLGSTLMQSPNCSEDFRSASKKNTFELLNSPESALFESHDINFFDKCIILSSNRNHYADNEIKKISTLSNSALLIYPHLGLDYSIYSHYFENNDTRLGVVHGTYHSGTVSLPGIIYKTKSLELENSFKSADIEAEIKSLNENAQKEMMSQYSILYLAKICDSKNIPIYIAPSKLGKDQYETMSVLNNECRAILLNMTTEAAYTKLLVALSSDLQEIDRFMCTNICNEMLD